MAIQVVKLNVTRQVVKLNVTRQVVKLNVTRQVVKLNVTGASGTAGNGILVHGITS